MRNALTKRLVASAAPRDRPYELRDGQVRGLLMRVQPSGHKAWIVTWAHGKRRTLGSVEHLSLDQAREVARQAVAEFVQSGLPSLAKRESPRISLEAFLENHYGPWARVELKGGADALRRVRQAFPGALSMSLSDIDAGWVQRWWVDRLGQTVRPDSVRLVGKATAGRNLATLRSVLSRAVAWGFLEQNPLLKLRMKSAQSNSVVRFLSPEEEGRLREALVERDRQMATARDSANAWRAARRRALLPVVAEGEYADHLAPVVLVSINTGLRRGELLRLDWSDINLESRMLTVRKEHAKSGKQRHVPLNAEAHAVLVKWRSQGPGAGSVFGVTSVKSSWERLLEIAKVEGFRFHDLRHHFASRLVMAGVDLNTVRELLGHADLAMTLRYAHLAPEHLAAAVAKLND